MKVVVYILKVFLLAGALFLLGCTVQKGSLSLKDEFIGNISFLSLRGIVPKVKYKKLSNTITKVTALWTLEQDIAFDDLKIVIRPAFQPTFHWAPHLTPQQNNIIAQHVFRAPAIICADAHKRLAIVPDLDAVNANQPVPWYMDNDAANNEIIIGMSNSRVQNHVLFTKAGGAIFPKGKTEISFYIFTDDTPAAIENPWRDVLSFMWDKWATPLYKNGEPLKADNLQPYVQQTYEWAFKNWKNVVWQQFKLNGKTVGAPVFIVNVTQSPNYKEPVNEREFRSIWNQAWFNSLRSASGLYRYAIRTNNNVYRNYALMTKELALSFPQQNGFFPSVIATEMEEITVNGKKYNRSKGWATHYFANSNRNPYTWNPKESPYHILDMSFTANQMLIWYNELEKDERLLSYAKTYADALIGIQFADGFFPAWLSLKDLKPLSHLNAAPETSMSVSFLFNLYKITHIEKYKKAAIKAMEAVINNNIYNGQWEDFETYWSCSRFGSDTLVGKKLLRNNQFKQNTLSVFYTAEALLRAYEITEDARYLKTGQRVLDEMLLYQAVWQPKFMAIRTLGGFGVMNGDAEWSDSRQSLFAPLIIEYGELLKNEEYIQRGIAALKASFTMMYTPLNPATMSQWQQRWPFFAQADYGFMMENYGHDGTTNNKGLGIGEFTIYDWGNGAAAEAYNRIVDAYEVGVLKNKCASF